MTILQDLFDIAPEFEVEETDTDALEKIDRFIERAKRKVDKTAVGNEYDELVAYKTAELMTRALPASASNGFEVVLSEKVDNGEIRYGNSDDAKAKRIKEFSDHFNERMGILCVGGLVMSNECS